MSIESFRVDKNEISIFAKCKDYDVAEITQHWFDYINSEITNQMSNWNKIVPSKNIGYLPSIERLDVELSPYEYIDGKNKPKFSVDTSKKIKVEVTDPFLNGTVLNKGDTSYTFTAGTGPYKDKVVLVEKLNDGLKSALSYSGCRTIKEFNKNAEWVEITNSGMLESKPHLL